ncbi:MAG: Ig domain-containing protein, partial [Acidimicrobiales bacterium]
LTAVSCVSRTFCVAGGGTGSASGGGQVVVYDGTRWSTARTVDPNEDLTSISCTSASFCIAVDGSGSFLLFNGLTWSPAEKVDSSPLTTVSCTPVGSRAFCAAFDDVGNALSFTGAAPGLLSIVPEALPEASLETPYRTLLKATGGRAPYRWAITAGSLPKGLHIDSATGSVAGVPSSDGTSVFSLTATDSTSPVAERAARTFEIAVTRVLDVVAYPLSVLRATPVKPDVALVSYPLARGGIAPPASSFRATVRWGDGARTTASISRSGPVAAGYAGYLVKPITAHSYGHLTVSPDVLTVVVHGPSGMGASAEAPVRVLPTDPTASFVINPVDPQNGGISLFMPQAAIAGQVRITKYVWRFLDNYNPVVDDSHTDGRYKRVISGLIAHPGSSSWRHLGIGLGILPKGALGGIAGIGGMKSVDVRHVAKVWEAYFPAHIVPHYFDSGSGKIGIQLRITDASGATSTFRENATVTRQCFAWGGVLSRWFGGFTTCDTYNGIASQFEPKRLPPDYVFLGASKGFAKGAFGLSVGAALVITKGILADPVDPRSVYLELFLDGSIGAPSSPGGPPVDPLVGMGWVGPPDKYQALVPSPANVDHYVVGLTVNAGFSLGVGFNAVYSPGGDTGFRAGEEIMLGAGSALGASYGEACSAPLAFAADQVATLQNLYQKFARGVIPSLATAVVDSVLHAAAGPGEIVGAAVQDLRTCLS